MRTYFEQCAHLEQGGDTNRYLGRSWSSVVAVVAEAVARLLAATNKYPGVRLLIRVCGLCRDSYTHVAAQCGGQQFAVPRRNIFERSQSSRQHIRKTNTATAILRHRIVSCGTDHSRKQHADRAEIIDTHGSKIRLFFLNYTFIFDVCKRIFFSFTFYFFQVNFGKSAQNLKKES